MQQFPVMPLVVRLFLLFILVIVLNPFPQPLITLRDWTQVRFALESGQLTAASASLNRIAMVYPWRSDLRLTAARMALQAGDESSGIQWMGRIDPQLMTYNDWLLLGDAHQSQGDLLMAEQAWHKALQLDSTYELYERLLLVHQNQTNIDAAAGDLENMHRLQPDNQSISYKLVLFLTVLDPSLSARKLDEVQINDPLLVAKVKKLEIKLAEATNAEHQETKYLIAGQALADLDEWILAKAAFQKAIESNNNYAEAWSYLGEARQHLDPPETEQALRDLRQGLALRPESVASLSMLALFWQRQEDFDQASSYYNAVIKKEPDNPAWQAAMGGLINAKGDLQLAEMYFVSATKLGPMEPVYWRLLTNFYLINQIQPNKALEAAERAVDLNSKDPTNLDTLGQAWMMLGDHPKARDFFQQAISLDPTFAPAFLHLGITDILEGQTSQARQNLQKARDLALDRATTDQADRLLSYYFP